MVLATAVWCGRICKCRQDRRVLVQQTCSQLGLQHALRRPVGDPSTASASTGTAGSTFMKSFLSLVPKWLQFRSNNDTNSEKRRRRTSITKKGGGRLSGGERRRLSVAHGTAHGQEAIAARGGRTHDGFGLRRLLCGRHEIAQRLGGAAQHSRPLFLAPAPLVHLDQPRCRLWSKSKCYVDHFTDATR